MLPLAKGSLLPVVFRKLLTKWLNYKDVTADTVGVAHTEKRQTPPHQTVCGLLGTSGQAGPATVFVLCFCMPCSVGIPPPTAGSCSTGLAHIITCAPPHAVHSSYKLPSHLRRPRDTPADLPLQTRAQCS